MAFAVVLEGAGETPLGEAGQVGLLVVTDNLLLFGFIIFLAATGAATEVPLPDTFNGSFC